MRSIYTPLYGNSHSNSQEKATMLDECQACPVDPFCLGLCSWTGCPGDADSESHLKLTTSASVQLLPPSTSNGTSTCTSHSNELHPPESSPSRNKRFSKFVDNEELALLLKGMTPANTNRNTKWALANFEAWRDIRNRLHPTDKVPESLRHCEDPSTLNLHLLRFAIETRKTNGKVYPPKTIHQLLCGLLRHM